MIKALARTSCILMSLVVGFISWYPLLKVFEYGVHVVPVTYAIASTLIIILSSMTFRGNSIIPAIVLLLTVSSVISLGVIEYDPTWFMTSSIVLLLSSGFVGRLYEVLILSSTRVPKSLKEKLLEFASRWNFVFGSIGCILLTLLLVHIGDYPVYTLSLVILLLSIALLLPFRPHRTSESEIKSLGVVPKVLFNYALLSSFAVGIIRPYIPAYLYVLGLDIVSLALLYGFTILISKIIASIAHAVVTARGPHSSMFIRTLVASLMLLTAATSEEPVVSAIAIVIFLVTTPLYSSAYMMIVSRCSKLSGYSYHRAEIWYTISSVIAGFVGLVFWLRTPRALPLISALLLMLTLPMLSRVKRFIEKELSGVEEFPRLRI